MEKKLSWPNEPDIGKLADWSLLQLRHKLLGNLLTCKDILFI